MNTLKRTAQCILFYAIFAIPAFGQSSAGNGVQPYFSAVVVTNAEKSSEWYQSVLGVKLRNVNENVERGSKIVVLSSGNVMLELIEVNSRVLPNDVLRGKPEQTLIVGFTKVGFRVTDLDAAVRRLTDLKVKFFGDVYLDPVSSKRSFLVQDPDNNLIQFFE